MNDQQCVAVYGNTCTISGWPSNFDGYISPGWCQAKWKKIGLKRQHEQRLAQEARQSDQRFGQTKAKWSKIRQNKGKVNTDKVIKKIGSKIGTKFCYNKGKVIKSSAVFALDKWKSIYSRLWIKYVAMFFLLLSLINALWEIYVISVLKYIICMCDAYWSVYQINLDIWDVP